MTSRCVFMVSVGVGGVVVVLSAVCLRVTLVGDRRMVVLPAITCMVVQRYGTRASGGDAIRACPYRHTHMAVLKHACHGAEIREWRFQNGNGNPVHDPHACWQP
eukprot:2747150-Rhodomonas_salina.1